MPFITRLDGRISSYDIEVSLYSHPTSSPGPLDNHGWFDIENIIGPDLGKERDPDLDLGACMDRITLPKSTQYGLKYKSLKTNGWIVSPG